MGTVIVIPMKIAEKIRKLGLDPESIVIEILTERLGMDPREAAEVHLELAEKYFREGLELVDKDPIQASEKLYKAAEEILKAIAKHLNLVDILGKVRERGRWTVTDLEKVARIGAKVFGEEIYVGWDRASYLHVWGFHEAKLDSEAVRVRAPYIEKMIELVKQRICGSS